MDYPQIYGRNHLGLRYNALSEHQMALITSGCVPGSPPAGRRRRASSSGSRRGSCGESRSMRQIWTVRQRVGPNHLGLCSNIGPRTSRRGGAQRARRGGRGRRHGWGSPAARTGASGRVWAATPFRSACPDQRRRCRRRRRRRRSVLFSVSVFQCIISQQRASFVSKLTPNQHTQHLCLSLLIPPQLCSSNPIRADKECTLQLAGQN